MFPDVPSTTRAFYLSEEVCGFPQHVPFQVSLTGVSQERLLSCERLEADNKDKDRTKSDSRSSSVVGAFETVRQWNALFTGISPVRAGNSKTEKMRTWSPSSVPSPQRTMDLNVSDNDMSTPPPPPSAWRDMGVSDRASEADPSGAEKVKGRRGAEKEKVDREKEKGSRKYATLSGRTSRILQDITGINLESSSKESSRGDKSQVSAFPLPELLSSRESNKNRNIGMPMSLRASTGVAGGKKRKLVVRGVSRTDIRAVEGVRKWCEVRS